MNNLRLSVRILILVGVALLLAAGSTAYLLQAIRDVAVAYHDVLDREVAQAQQAREIQVTLKKQVQSWKDILLRGCKHDDRVKYGEEFSHYESEVQRLAESLRASISAPEAKEKVAQLIAAHEALGRKYSEGLALFDRTRGRKWAEVDRMLKGQDRPLTNLIDGIVVSLNKQVKQKTEAEDAAQAARQHTLLVVSIVSFAVVFLGTFFFARSLSNRLHQTVSALADLAEGQGDLTARLPCDAKDEMGDIGRYFNEFVEKLGNTILQVSSNIARLAIATEEISASANQQSTGMEAQKGQTQQVATAMHQMASTVAQISQTSSSAAEAARKASATAQDGGKIVEGTLKKMREIAVSVGETAKKVNGLGARSDQIGQIIETIDDIADQTNLLALNAAIEAARAGEQGRGFAVVADEVRKLAERTSKATKETTAMIEGIQADTKSAVAAMELGTKQVEAGVETTTQAGASLAEIIRAAERVGEMVTQIATAANQQSSATEEVNTSIEQIARISEQSTHAAGQSATACQELASLALDLEKLVEQFKLKAQDSPAPAASRAPASSMTLSQRKQAFPEKFVPARIHAVPKQPAGHRAA